MESKEEKLDHFAKESFHEIQARVDGQHSLGVGIWFIGYSIAFFSKALMEIAEGTIKVQIGKYRIWW